MIWVLLLIVSGFGFYLEHPIPFDETTKEEFLATNPSSLLVNVELIFVRAPKNVLTYLMKFRTPDNNEI